MPMKRISTLPPQKVITIEPKKQTIDRLKKIARAYSLLSLPNAPLMLQ